MQLPNVCGVGIGEKEDRQVIKVFVKQKLAESELQPQDIVPMEIRKIKLDQIAGSAYQPRFQEDLEINNLVASILENGLLQPLILRETKKGKYDIISGNRRVAALKIIQKAGHQTLPEGAASIGKNGEIELETVALSQKVSDEDVAIAALISNEERLNLQPLERAHCYKYMIEQLEISIGKLAKKLGKSKTDISRLIRFLERLPTEIQQAWNDYKISLRHVEIILRLPDYKRQMELYKMIIEKKLNLPETEFYCARLLTDEEVATEDKQFDLLEEDIIKNHILKDWLENKRIRMTKSRIGEKITINIKSRSEFTEVLQLILDVLKIKKR